MEEFAFGWCRHHFSFPGINLSIPVPSSSAQDSYTAPPGWPPTETPFHSFPHSVRGPSVQISSTHAAGPPPSEPASDDKEPGSMTGPFPDGSPDDDEASLPDPGPVEEAPPDREARAGYLRLLLATECHRRELQRRRRAEQAPPALQMSADTERLREQQMRRLYGAAAGQVAAAESRAQLQFDTFTDRHRPPLWPNVPLKIRFA